MIRRTIPKIKRCPKCKELTFHCISVQGGKEIRFCKNCKYQDKISKK